MFIYIVIPTIGIAVYTLLVKQMKRQEIADAPQSQLFWLFGTYGVVLILILTSLIWKWSGMASIGVFGSVTIGSLVAAVSAYSVYGKRKLTIYHKWTYFLSIGYLGFILFLICMSLIYHDIK